MRKLTVRRPCPCCARQEVEPVVAWTFDEDNLTLRLGRCLNCKMVYVTNSDEVDMSNRRYVSWKPPTDDDVMTPEKLAHNQGILDLVSKYIPPGASVLDYGAGYCGFLRVAKAEGYEVEGINPCRYLADWAKRKLDIKVHDVFGQEFESDKQFDLIVSDQTFEHLENPAEDLKKIYTLLKEGGIAYINVPNFSTYSRLLHGLDCIKDISHYNYFTPKTLAKLCGHPGFRILRIAPTIGVGIVRRTIKSALDRLGVGDCSVLIQKIG